MRMWTGCHKHWSRSKKSAVARGLLAAALFSASVLQGLTLCLCAPDPDGCGERCHDCGSAPEPQSGHLDHVCEHLTISALAPSEKVTSATVKTPAAPLPGFYLRTQPGFSLTLRTKPFAHPPDILSPQFTFIARSTQMLC